MGEALQLREAQFRLDALAFHVLGKAFLQVATGPAAGHFVHEGMGQFVHQHVFHLAGQC